MTVPAIAGIIPVEDEAIEVVGHDVRHAAPQAEGSLVRLGDKRVDVILVDPVTMPQPIHALARRDGIRL
jgi:hypothetical protein